MKNAIVETASPPGFCPAGYEMLETIGEGGFGTVYKAKQKSTGQLVAIKTLRLREFPDSQKRKQQIARFERETEMCAEINHPHIVRLIDKGYDADGAPFAVYEYVAGETLKDYILRNGSLSASEAGELMGQVLDALCCAHALGIVHRDLKPQNMMVTKTGSRPHVKVLDFGIGGFTHDARNLDYRSLTLTQEVLGTPTYCAPEQLRGEPITLRSDLYAWGLILIECLTGQPVMQGNSVAEVFEQQLSGSNVPLPPSISGHPLADLLRKVLEKNPRQRLGQAELVLTEFGKINFSSLVGKIQAHAFAPQDLEEAVTGLNHLGRSNRVDEKKQITVLCTKISLSVSDDSILDIETLDTLQKDQLNLCKDTASRFGGHIAGSLADNVIVYFGYPQTNDTDARRAGRTALELMNQAQRRSALLLEKHGVSLSIRMSMHTGTVLASPVRTPEGLVPNTAFDLLYRAEPGTVLVSDVTRKLLDPYLEFEAGMTAHFTTTSYLLVGERQTEAMSFLRPSSADRDMVGREPERLVLSNLWHAAQTQGGKAALIQGQAGIGKSKLVFEAKKQVRNEGYVVRECRCLPEHQNNALYAFTDMLRRHFGIHEGGDAAFAFEKLEASVVQAGLDAATTLPILCAWLNLSLAAGYPLSTLPPDQQKIILFDSLKKLIGQLGQGEKFLLVVEDLHWIDPTGQEFLAEMVAASAQGNALILMTARPEYSPEWDVAHYAHLNLNPLEINATKALVEAVLQGKGISDKAIAYINDKGDGVPLYIEEFTATLLERNFLVLGESGYDLIDKIDEQSIPETLSDLLNARLDRLGYAKETAQLAATIGREFNYDLLAKASLRDEAAVQSDLESLLGADLIFQQRRVQGDAYVFRHALIRDAAYESMGSGVRKAGHLRVAESLKASFPEVVEANPFEVGRHLAEGGEYEEGVTFGIQAIERQVGSSSNREANNTAHQIQSWVNEIPEEVPRLEKEITLNNTYSPALMALQGYGGKEVFEVNQRNQELIKKLQNHSHDIDIARLEKIVQASEYSVFNYYHHSGNRTKAHAIGEQLIVSFRDRPDLRAEVAIYPWIAQSYHAKGEYDHAEKLLQRVLEMYDEEKCKGLELEYGIDPLSSAHFFMGHVLVWKGSPERGKRHYELAVEAAERTHHLTSILIAYLYKAGYGACVGNPAYTIETAETFMEKHSNSFEGGAIEDFWVFDYLKIYWEWALEQAKFSEPRIRKFQDSGQNFAVSCYIPFLVKTYLKQGDAAKGIPILENAIAYAQENQEGWTLPEILRLLALSKYEIEGQLTPEIENLFQEGLHESRRVGTLWFELDLLGSYGKILKALDRLDEIKEDLESILAQVGEGHDLPAYQQAQALFN